MIEQTYEFAVCGIASDDIFFDFGNASARNKPVFNIVLEKIKKGEVSSLVVTFLDQISRNLLDFQSFMQVLMDFQVELIVLDQPEF